MKTVSSLIQYDVSIFHLTALANLMKFNLLKNSFLEPYKGQPLKMVKHTQAIRRQFHSNVSFLYSLKTSENLYFLTFSGGIEM